MLTRKPGSGLASYPAWYSASASSNAPALKRASPAWKWARASRSFSDGAAAARADTSDASSPAVTMAAIRVLVVVVRGGFVGRILGGGRLRRRRRRDHRLDDGRHGRRRARRLDLLARLRTPAAAAREQQAAQRQRRGPGADHGRDLLPARLARCLALGGHALRAAARRPIGHRREQLGRHHRQRPLAL